MVYKNKLNFLIVTFELLKCIFPEPEIHLRSPLILLSEKTYSYNKLNFA